MHSNPEHLMCVNIIEKLNSENETGMFSIFNLSELFFVLQREKCSFNKIKELIRGFVKLRGIQIVELSTETVLLALDLATKYEIDLTDAANYLLMKKYKIREIYSLDRHFDKFKDIQRIQ